MILGGIERSQWYGLSEMGEMYLHISQAIIHKCN